MDLIAAPIDFFGVNFYTRKMVGAIDGETVERGSETAMGWEIHPPALGDLLLFLHEQYHFPKIFITENGAAMPDDQRTADGRVADHDRLAYIESHLEQVLRVIDHGVPVAGYFAWSLLDNFEWAFGYEPRFGLVEVDFETQHRTPKLERVVVLRCRSHQLARRSHGESIETKHTNQSTDQQSGSRGDLNMATVRFDKVTKRYPNGFEAVTDLDLEVADGELLVVVGPSGCGKSTTLRMLAGLEDLSEGRIFIGDQCVNEIEARRRNIAMVFQSYALYPHLTVGGNLAYPLKVSGMAKAERDQRVLQVAKLLRLTDLLDRKPRQLSGGQRQRVAMGRAMVREPEVFLMDEPLSNLDAKLRVAMRAEVSELQRSLEATMFYVTHDQVEAMTMGDRVAVMDQGRLQQVSTPDELYNAPLNAFVAGFIGSPPMNRVRATVRNDEKGAPTVSSGTVDLSLLSPELAPRLASLGGPSSGEFIVGFRPEHLEVAPDGFGLPIDVASGRAPWFGTDCAHRCWRVRCVQP